MTVRRDNAYVHPYQATTVCDACGRTFLPRELEWGVTHWQTSSLDRGEVTATLCRRCARFAWVHCWRCGRLCAAGGSGECRACQGGEAA